MLAQIKGTPKGPFGVFRHYATFEKLFENEGRHWFSAEIKRFASIEGTLRLFGITRLIEEFLRISFFKENRFPSFKGDPFCYSLVLWDSSEFSIIAKDLRFFDNVRLF